MEGYGFIRTKEDVKFLILYVLKLLKEPCDFDELAEMSLVDGGFTYFDLADAYDELEQGGYVETERTDKGRLCTITLSGRLMAKEFEYSIPSVVREAAKLSSLRVTRRRLRNEIITANVQRREDGTLGAVMAVMDGNVPVIKLELMVADEHQGESVCRAFKQHAERIYDGILCVLANDYGSSPEDGF